MRLTYKERSERCKNNLAKELFILIDKKQTNLALSADVTHCEKLLSLAEKTGPEICVLKIHVDILSDFSQLFIEELKKIAKKYEFLIFEDRKFADIGSTVQHQYQGGIYKISEWANIINAHSLPGPGIVQGLSEIGLKKNRGLLLLAEMSSEQNFIDEDYTKKTVKLAKQFDDFVIGFISQHKLDDNPHWIYMTPGVRFAEAQDALGQQYVTPEKAIKENGSDIIIVGRGIINAGDPIEAARKYREAGWNAYLGELA